MVGNYSYCATIDLPAPEHKTNDLKSMTSGNPALVIIMPVHNEMHAVESVLEEWLAELRKHDVTFKIMLFDDGSTDETVQRVRTLANREQQVEIVVRSNNIGHGKTCLLGYEIALQSCDADWLLQLDSDGQCDPSYFKEFWQSRKQGFCIQGFRRTRADGMSRLLISRVMSLVVLLMTGRLVRDLNSPFRLMDRETLLAACKKVPRNIDLANAALTYIYHKDYSIEWIPIHFKERKQYKAPLTPLSSIPIALSFIRQFKQSF